jgi:hypothetical protein
MGRTWRNKRQRILGRSKRSATSHQLAWPSQPLPTAGTPGRDDAADRPVLARCERRWGRSLCLRSSPTSPAISVGRMAGTSGSLWCFLRKLRIYLSLFDLTQSAHVHGHGAETRFGTHDLGKAAQPSDPGRLELASITWKSSRDYSVAIACSTLRRAARRAGHSAARMPRSDPITR